MQLKQGTLLQGGKYEIEGVLGQGGFGITYLAIQVGLNRKVAIKEFFIKDLCGRNENTNQVFYISSSDGTLVDNFKKKFLKEAQTISSLNHTNIIRIHDNFEENGTAYYAMEYIEGNSISEILNVQGKFSEEVAVQYIKQVANALAYIHSKHINHLDIKPSNIMIRHSDNRVVLIDFGVAKQYDVSTGDGTTSTPVGVTHGYSPLEQYSEGGVKNFSPQSDIYALGATLYRMVIGEKPPHAISISQNGFPMLPQTISMSMRSVISMSMKQKRSERPQSVESFIKILDGQCSDEDTIVNDTTPLVNKKSQAGLIIVAVVFTLIILSTLGYIWSTNKAGDNLSMSDTLSIDTLESVEQEELNDVITETFVYKKDNGDNHVEFSIEYPVSGSPNLVRNVVEWINESFGGKYKGDLKDGQALVDFYGKDVEFDPEYNTEEVSRVKLITQTSKYATFEYETYSYAGGIHGIGRTFCATFRKDDGRKFGWDMFSNYEGLQTEIKKGLKKYFQVSTDSELEENLQLPDENTINSIPMPETEPWVTSEGITFHYNAYEIACYAAGEPTFTIPTEKIKNCLTSTAIDLIYE